MKKIYKSPETCIVIISTKAMFADSLPMDDENKINSSDMLSRRGRRGRQRDVWDDEEEEEEY
jgi:hypothetical protein